jgi:hypothetical protein
VLFFVWNRDKCPLFIQLWRFERFPYMRTQFSSLSTSLHVLVKVILELLPMFTENSYAKRTDGSVLNNGPREFDGGRSLILRNWVWGCILGCETFTWPKEMDGFFGCLQRCYVWFVQKFVGKPIVKCPLKWLRRKWKVDIARGDLRLWTLEGTAELWCGLNCRISIPERAVVFSPWRPDRLRGQASSISSK